MSKLFATPIIAAAFAFAAAWAIAADQIAQQTAPPGDSTRPTLTPEEQAKAKAEAAAKKEANSKTTPAEKKAANAAKQKELKAERQGGDTTRPTLTPEEQAKAKAEAAAKKEANSKMTPAEKKAANAAKQKALKESTKDSKQDKP
jgi:hypothetical protein